MSQKAKTYLTESIKPTEVGWVDILGKTDMVGSS